MFFEKGFNFVFYLKRELKNRNLNIFLVNGVKIFMYIMLENEERVRNVIVLIFGCMIICFIEERYFYFIILEF